MPAIIENNWDLAFTIFCGLAWAVGVFLFVRNHLRAVE